MTLKVTTLRRIVLLLILTALPAFPALAASAIGPSATFASALLGLRWQVNGFAAIAMSSLASSGSIGVGWFDNALVSSIEQRPSKPAVAVAIEVDAEQPGRLFLDQNYPNPFNPSTMIRYGLPGGTRVRLSVHTLIGTRIRVLIDQHQEPGVYTFDMLANDLPSGAYFYRIQTDFGTITRRMIVSK